MYSAVKEEQRDVRKGEGEGGEETERNVQI